MNFDETFPYWVDIDVNPGDARYHADIDEQLRVFESWLDANVVPNPGGTFQPTKNAHFRTRQVFRNKSTHSFTWVFRRKEDAAHFKLMFS